MAGQLRLLSSATAPQGEMIEKSKRAANWAKSFEIFKQVASMGKQVADAEAKNKSKQDAINNMVDSHKAKADAAIFNQAVSNQNGTERRASYEGILGDMTRQFEQGDISQGYYQGYMGSIEGNYDTALGDQQLEYNNAVGESSGSEFMAGVEAGIAGDATVYIDNVNRNTGVPKAVIRDGVLSGVYKNFTTKIDATTNLRELNNTVAAFNDVKVNSLSSTNLLKTRSKELAAKVAQLETNIKGSISAKKKQFKYEAGERVADAIGSVEDPLNQYSKTPSEVDNDISIVNEDNAQAELAAKNTYKTKYDTHQEAKKFVAKNTVFDVVNAGIVKDNEVLKPIWEDSVQNAFMNFYIKGDMNSAIKVSNTQSAFLGEVGDTMYSTFSSTSSPEVLQQFLQADRLYRTTPGGKTAHNNLYSVEQRQSIIMTDIVTNSIGFDDPFKAREMVARAQASPIKPQLPKRIHLMQDKRRKDLGSAYQDYRASLNVLNNLEGVDITTAEKQLVEYYEGRDIDKEYQGEGFFSSDFTVDTQYGMPMLSADEGRHYELTASIITKLGIDPETVKLKIMPDGMVAVNDSVFDTPLFMINPNEIEKTVQDEIKNRPGPGPLERRFRAGGEHAVSGASGIQEAVVEAVVPAVENIASRQGTLTMGLFSNILTGIAHYFMSSEDIDMESEASSNNPVDAKYSIAKKIQDENLSKLKGE